MGGRLAPELQSKYDQLQSILAGYGRIVVAFSGGVDSSLLLCVAHEVLRDDALAMMADTPFTLSRERLGAVNFCEARGIPLKSVRVDLMSSDAICANPRNRCYLCKRAIFSALLKEAESRGVEHVADGTNADDADEDRPGVRALRELGVKSPLREAGLTKSDVRSLSRELGLPTWDKGSNTCLATRLPYGSPITIDELKAIDAAEQFLVECGFERVRVRAHGPLARIEVSPGRIHDAASPATRRLVSDRLHELGFAYVCLDLEPLRSGSMDR